MKYDVFSFQPSAVCRKSHLSLRSCGYAPAHVRRSRRAFTLTELLIAIAVLIIVLLAASRIFSTASQVTGIGQATSDVMTEAAAIERQIRKDFDRITHEGVFVIRCVGVRNDINRGSLLRPELPADAIIRCDQLVFFTKGVENAQDGHLGRGRNSKSQSCDAFVYYGHAFQIPDGGPAQVISAYQAYAYDAAPTQAVYPWTTGLIDMVRTNFVTVGSNGTGTNVYSTTAAGQSPINQPGARQWLLSRVSAILGDDDTTNANANSKTVYINQVSTARSLFIQNQALSPSPAFLSPQIRDGRVDGAATQLDAVRRRILNAGNTWAQRKQYILDQLVYYPRAERVALSSSRVDQALTSSVISSGCSSFIVDWMYDLGVGDATSVDPGASSTTFPGTVHYNGMSTLGLAGSFNLAPYERGVEVRWFGLAEAMRGVLPFSYSGAQWPDGWTGQPETVDPANIEQFVNHNPAWQEVNYVFGFNQDKPFLNPITNMPDSSFGTPATSVAYTPWPSAVRITMVLHDPGGKLRGGRTFQFVVRLPQRNP